MIIQNGNTNIDETCLQGYIECSYDDLVGAFGKPTVEGGIETKIEVEWQFSNNTSFMVRLKIEGEDRKGLAKDIVECTSSLNMNITSVDMKGDQGLARCTIIVEVRDTKQLNRLQTKLKTINRIYKIERR